VLEDVVGDHLTVAGDGLVFIDRSAGELFPTGHRGGAIRRIGADGTGDRLLYTAPADRLILSLAIFGDDVFFLEDAYAGVAQPDDVALHRVPLAAGPATLVGSLSRPRALVTELIAVEADEAYVNVGEDGIFRVALAGGRVEAVTTERILRNTALVGDDLFYTASEGIGMSALERVAKTATDAMGTVVLTDECKDGLVGEAGIFCRVTTVGVASVVRYDLDGTGRTQLAELEPIGDFPGQVVALGEDHVYVAASDLPSLDGHPIWRIPVGGGEKTAVACDRHEFTVATGQSPSPTSGLRLEQVVVGATDLFWLERRTTGGPMSLFKAPR
jgi:hypothetical protein